MRGRPCPSRVGQMIRIAGIHHCFSRLTTGVTEHLGAPNDAPGSRFRGATFTPLRPDPSLNEDALATTGKPDVSVRSAPNTADSWRGSGGLKGWFVATWAGRPFGLTAWAMRSGDSRKRKILLGAVSFAHESLGTPRRQPLFLERSHNSAAVQPCRQAHSPKRWASAIRSPRNGSQELPGGIVSRPAWSDGQITRRA